MELIPFSINYKIKLRSISSFVNICKIFNSLNNYNNMIMNFVGNSDCEYYTVHTSQCEFSKEYTHTVSTSNILVLY